MTHAPTAIKAIVSRHEIGKVLREVICDDTGLEPDDIRQDTKLDASIGIDEFTRTTIIGKLELIFRVRLTEDVFGYARTVKVIGDAIYYAQGKEKDKDLLAVFLRAYKQATGIDSVSMTMQTDLRLDLRIDSTTMQAIASILQDELKVKISWCSLCGYTVVSHVVSYLRSRIRDA